MSTLIDLCGTPIQLEHIRSFRLVKRDCIYYPAYQEVQEQSFSLFARKNAANKKKFEFIKMVPFGVLLSDREKPLADNYEIKSFGEAAAFNILSEMGKAFGNAATLAADMLKIDTSGNTEYNILTEGRRLTRLKLRDIPAKVRFLSGKVSDVYKNDPIYEFLGEPIAPTVVAVPALVVSVDKTTRVFFGGGIDLEDAAATYHSLLDAYNRFQEEKNIKKNTSLPKFPLSIPALSIPSIKVPSPFANRGNTSELPEASQSADAVRNPQEDTL